MAHITLKDGRWIELRPMYVDDELAIYELAEAGSAMEAGDDEAAARRYFGLLRDAKRLIDDATTAASWEGGAERLQRDDLLGLIAQWRTATEDDALPPVNEPSSETQ
jgi:hypothetical protein